MSEKALMPIEQKEIKFYDDLVVALRLEDGTVCVPIRPICDVLGINWASQSKRIKRDDVLSENVTVVIMATVKGKREMLALPVEYLNGWMFGLTTSKLKPELQAKLKQYKQDCYRVLAEAFGRNNVTARPDDKLMQSAEPSAVAYRNALAIAKIAREQFYLTEQLKEQQDALDGQQKQIGQLDQRLSLVEANLGNDERYVTKEQASHLSQGVRAIGTVLSKRSGKNEYAAVYGELYRTWSVASYKEVAAANYDSVIAWLRNWYLELVDESDCPF